MPPIKEVKIKRVFEEYLEDALIELSRDCWDIKSVIPPTDPNDDDVSVVWVILAVRYHGQ